MQTLPIPFDDDDLITILKFCTMANFVAAEVSYCTIQKKFASSFFVDYPYNDLDFLSIKMLDHERTFVFALFLSDLVAEATPKKNHADPGLFFFEQLSLIFCSSLMILYYYSRA